MPELTIVRWDLPDGLTDYHDAWQRQRDLHAARLAGAVPDTCVLVQHPPVFTAGRRTQDVDRPSDGTPVVEVDRGGEITFHGPGQVVGYPVVTLPVPVNVVHHVRRQEEAIIRTCADFGVPATRIDGRSGVWVLGDGVPSTICQPSRAGEQGLDRKVAAVGVRVSRMTTLHGFALNCDVDLSWFDRIGPCGIHDAGVTSLTAETGRPVTIRDVLPALERHLQAVLLADGTVPSAAGVPPQRERAAAARLLTGTGRRA